MNVLLIHPKVLLPAESQRGDLLSESQFGLDREFSIGRIGKSSNRANLGAERFAITEVTGHGPLGLRMDDRCSIRTRIDAGFATHAPLRVGDDGSCLRNAFPGVGWTGCHAGSLFTMLTDDRHVDSNLGPVLDLDSRECGTGNSLVRETADDFA